MTRRDVVKRALAMAALGAGSTFLGHEPAPAAGLPAGRAASGGRTPNRRRVAIIGAGAGGVAAAYFLADSHDVDLFEARSKIGGHCDTHEIDYRGHRLAVDLGAQFFHPDTHPLYVTLLEQLGLYDPARPDTDDTLAAAASLCIFPTAGGPPTFSSSHPLSTPHRAIEFLTYLPLARHAVLSDLSWETTVERGVRGLPVSQPFKDEIVYPWTTALIGVFARRRADGIGTLDPADVRVGVPGQRRAGSHDLQLDDRPAGQPATHAESQPKRAGTPQHPGARARA